MLATAAAVHAGNQLGRLPHGSILKRVAFTSYLANWLAIRFTLSNQLVKW